MFKKPSIIIFSLITTTLFFSSCKKEKVLLDVGDACESVYFHTPEVSITGNDIENSKVELIINKNKNTFYGRQWVTPNGEVIEGNYLKIVGLDIEDRGVYKAYYTSKGYCLSQAASIFLDVKEAATLTAPCTRPKNFLHMRDGVIALRNSLLTKVEHIKDVNNSTYTITGEESNQASIEIIVNTVNLIEGRYKVRTDKNFQGQGLQVYVSIMDKTRGDEYKFLHGDDLYIINNGGVFEMIACEAKLSQLGNSRWYETDIRIVLD